MGKISDLIKFELVCEVEWPKIKQENVARLSTKEGDLFMVAPGQNLRPTIKFLDFLVT